MSILSTANRHLTKFHRTPGAVSHHTETAGVSLDSIHRIVGPLLRGRIQRVSSLCNVGTRRGAAKIHTSECSLNGSEINYNRFEDNK